METFGWVPIYLVSELRPSPTTGAAFSMIFWQRLSPRPTNSAIQTSARHALQYCRSRSGLAFNEHLQRSRKIYHA